MATVECPSCRTSNPSEALYCSACGAAMHRSDGDDMIGQTVGGRYHLVEKIGQGSAGTLYRAEHVTLRRRMAVKLLHKQLALSDEAVERFRREAITVCEIDNDHIPQVHDFGRTDDEQLFFAMEFLDGETLSAVLEREGRVSPERTADVLSQLADGLMEAHTLGYVHRDLRPRSVFLTRRRGRQDFVKILDFGLAKLVQPEVDAQRTAMGMTYGDPRYMAPEQARGEATDRRADIYSLGVLGFEMLVGEPPFKGGGTFEVLQKVLDAPVPRVRERRLDCPPWLESVVRTALAKRPADRFQTVAQLLDALERKQLLPNQPPMPMQLTSQQASKLASVKDKETSAPRGGSAAQMQVFVSSPSLRAIPVASEVAPPAPNATQAMPTVAPGIRTTVPGQGPVRSPAPAAPAPPTAAPRMTMSYPSVKLSHSGTAPGVSEYRPGQNPEPPTLTGESKSTANSDMRLLGERLPPGETKSAPGRAAATRSALSVQPVARAAESAAKPSLLVASTTQPRNDPTPRTARAMLQQEAMAWEEAALPVLGTNDLTDAASLSEPTGRAPSADTPVEEMKFAPGAASTTSPTAEASAVAPRPISAPAIAAMRSMFPGPGGPKASEQHKAVASSAANKSSPAVSPVVPSAAKSSPALSPVVPSAAKSSPALSPIAAAAKSSPAVSPVASSAAKSSPALSPSVTSAAQSSPVLSPSVAVAIKASAALNEIASGGDKSSAQVSASASGISRLAAAGKSSDQGTRPLVAVSRPEEKRAGASITAPLPRLAETAIAAADTASAVGTPVESAPFGVDGALNDTEDDEDVADATIPQIRSSRDDETPIIVHNAASARSPLPSSSVLPGTVAPPDTLETPAQLGASGDPAANLPHDTPLDGLPRAAGAESNWFSSPATSASDTFANDDNEVVIGRRRVPKWTLAVAAGGVLLLGVVILVSRTPSPPPVTTPPPVTSSPATVAVPTPVVPVPTTTPPPPEAVKPEPASPPPGPEVSPLPVATAIPSSAPVKPIAGTEVSPSVAATPPGNEKPVVTPRPEPATPTPGTKENKPTAVAMNPVSPPETRPSENPEPKAKPVAAPPVAKPGKATAENKAKLAAEKTKAESETKVAAKPEKTPKVTAAEAVPADKVEKKPGEAGALVQNAKKKLEDGEPDAATALFARAVELDPRSAEAVGGLGESYFEQGNFEAAARHLGKAARLAPRRASYQELLVQALYKVNKFKEAAEACRKLLKLAPGSAKAKQTLELAEKKLGAG